MKLSIVECSIVRETYIECRRNNNIHCIEVIVIYRIEAEEDLIERNGTFNVFKF